MARPLLPDPLERRVLMEKQLDAAHALRIADAYLAEERVIEALAFLSRAGATDRLMALREQAVATGDAFLLREVCRELGQPPAAPEWRSLSDAAEAAGKLRYADQGRRQLGRTVEG